MRNKPLNAVALVLLIIAGCVYLIAMSSADDEKLRTALNEAGIKISQEVNTDRAIANGQVITEQDVYEVEIPANEARAEAFLCKADVIGKRTVGAMEPDQPLTIQDLGLSREVVLNNEIERLKKHNSKSNGFCSHSVDTKVREPEKFVYKATSDIPEGERIKAGDIKTLPAAENDTKNCIGDIRLVANHMAKYGIESGQLLHPHNFATVGKDEEDAFVATRDLKPGDVVKPEDIAKKHFEKNKCSANAILDENLIAGSNVVQPITRDQVFRVIDLQASTKK
jgi:flagella basal body P-ring formation protein FlgA